jgi:hypothetical protein
MHLARSLCVACSLVALLLGCAGRIEYVGTLDPGIVADDGGPESGVPPVQCPPPNQVGTDVLCSDEGQTCPTELLTGCNGGPGTIPVNCICTRGSWACSATLPSCPGPPTGTCPSLTQVVAGLPCNVDPGLDCVGNPQPCNGIEVYDTFQCLQAGEDPGGYVWVDVTHNFCPPDAGTEAGSFDGGFPWDGGAGG